jgi:hypothetical protein
MENICVVKFPVDFEEIPFSDGGIFTRKESLKIEGKNETSMSPQI